ncbi:hypothetical protein JB92DRAFT_448952 [Gautieria morchelliformis]|nr:hypothetical protein JB92DRAFT_448952 [Gautieria morchelliformis]
MPLPVQRAVMFMLHLLGFVSLSALLFTVVLSENMHRHTVFFNFVCTYILYTSVTIFACVLQVTSRSTTTEATGEKGCGGVGFHSNRTNPWCGHYIQYCPQFCEVDLWFEIRAASSCVNAWTTKPRTFTCLLFDISQQRGTSAMNYLELSLVILTCLWDILLVVAFCSYRRIFRRVNMVSPMTISLLTRLSVFCLFRLLFAVIVMASIVLYDRNPHSNVTLIMLDATHMGESLYPILAFLLLGIQRDVLRVWFPCIHFGAPQACTTGSNWALDTEFLAIHDDVALPQSRTAPESWPDMQDIH